MKVAHPSSRPWIGQMFHSEFEINTRGTAILIGKKVWLIPTMSISDPKGHYIIVTGMLYQTPVVLFMLLIGMTLNS